MNRIQCSVFGSTASHTERRNFTHVIPDSVEVHILMPEHKFVSPKISRLRMMPVWVDSIPRPDRSHVEAAVWVFDVKVVGSSSSVGIIPAGESANPQGFRLMAMGERNLHIGSILRVWDV
jgi:hypothetical protein